MNFQCKNCGGNVVFNPEKQKMVCPYCDSIESEEQGGNDSLTVCASCGGEIKIGQFTNASRCQYCGNYLIFDERIKDELKPDTILPFKISKEQAVEALNKELKSRIFTPSSFLSEKTLTELNGYYVPFFLYDYDALGDADGIGTKTRSWTSGEYNYTETSYYHVVRKMRARYDNIPVDASIEMDDKVMDLIEPYEYKFLTDFDPRLMSGFFGEYYNYSKQEMEPRAFEKAETSAKHLLDESLEYYSFGINKIKKSVSLSQTKTDFTLLPVWMYAYKYGGKIYKYYVNGQSGKVIGTTPVSREKVLAYGTTVGLVVYGILKLIVLASNLI